MNPETKPTKMAPPCPQCDSKVTGEEVKGEWYCYACGNQWKQVRGERT
jgi:ribosomal protein L37AE/L43A